MGNRSCCYLCGAECIRLQELRCEACHQEYTQYRLAIFWQAMESMSLADVPKGADGVGKRQRPTGHEERIAVMSERAARGEPVK